MVGWRAVSDSIGKRGGGLEGAFWECALAVKWKTERVVYEKTKCEQEVFFLYERLATSDQ